MRPEGRAGGALGPCWDFLACCRAAHGVGPAVKTVGRASCEDSCHNPKAARRSGSPKFKDSRAPNRQQLVREGCCVDLDHCGLNQLGASVERGTTPYSACL